MSAQQLAQCGLDGYPAPAPDAWASKGEKPAASTAAMAKADVCQRGGFASTCAPQLLDLQATFSDHADKRLATEFAKTTITSMALA